MMMYIRPFGQVGVTVNTVGAGVVALTRSGVGTQSVRVVNSGTDTAFLEFGKDAGVVANVASSMPVLAGTVETFLLPNDITHIAVAGATGTIYFTTGESA